MPDEGDISFNHQCVACPRHKPSRAGVWHCLLEPQLALQLGSQITKVALQDELAVDWMAPSIKTDTHRRKMTP